MSPTQAPQRARERTLEDAANDAEAARLRTAGLSYREIAAQVGCDVHTAHDRVKRALAAVPVQAVEELRAESDEHLRALMKIAYREATRDHLLVQGGKIVTDDDGQPLVDHAAKLRAVAELRALNESLRKLWGTDPPVKTRLEVITEDVLDEEYRRLTAEMEEREAGAVDAAAS